MTSRTRRLRRIGRVAFRNASEAAPSFEEWLGVYPVSPGPVVGGLDDELPLLLSDVEDRRTWHPEPVWDPPFREAPSGLPARFKVGPPTPRASKRSHRPLDGLVGVFFRTPSRVVVCVRRQRRKEVLHAKGVAGRSGLARGRPGPGSGISCKG